MSFGRLSWQPSLSSEHIADEWTKAKLLTSTPSDINAQIKKDDARQPRGCGKLYDRPLAYITIFAWGHHYGPEPWCNIPGARPDWLPSYYHRADKQGIGFDRSSKGSNAVAQYPENLSKQYDNISTCPEEYLLWFHHVPWNYRMKSGRTLWDELCYHYDNGVRQVRDFQKIWDAAEK